MNQKKIILLVALTILSVSVKAQTYTQAFDSVFFHISRADATSGILYERVLPFGNLTNFNSQIAAPDTVIILIFSELIVNYIMPHSIRP